MSQTQHIAESAILEAAENPAAFRQAVRAWLVETMARRAALGADDGHYERQQWWMAERRKAGLATPHWPSAYGGVDLSLRNHVILAEEIARARAPALDMFIISLNHVPHTLIAWGSEAQKRKYLPGVAEGVVWCQGFSEPSAGSDLASLRTRAVRDGDHYVVNGQKIWSSYSMYAEHCILLARTGPEAPKHRGISYFLLDMKAPGVEVRPIRQATGEAEFAEIFLTDVRIPAEDLVGEENQGWAVAQTTPSAERGVLAFEIFERQRYEMEDVFASAVVRNAPWLSDAHMRREYLRLFGEMQACRRLLRRLLREVETASPEAAATVVHAKVIYTSLDKRIGEFMLRAQGLHAQICRPAADQVTQTPMYNYLFAFGTTIAGGSNEIMRNLISERILGMPRG